MKKIVKLSPEELQKQKRELTANQWIPIADIDENIVYRKDGTLVGMLRVQPLNINLLSDREQRIKVSALTEELNGEKEPFQIFCIGRPVDLNNFLEWLKDKAKQEKDRTKKRLLNNFIKEASYKASSGETIERRFYIIITKPDAKKAEVDLINRLKELKRKLLTVGLISKVCTDDELLDVYSLFSYPIQASFERATADMLFSPILKEV